MLVTSKPLHSFGCNLVFRGFGGACLKYQVRFYFQKLLKFPYKETYETITSENLGHSDKLVVMVTPDNLGNQK